MAVVVTGSGGSREYSSLNTPVRLQFLWLLDPKHRCHLSDSDLGGSIISCAKTALFPVPTMLSTVTSDHGRMFVTDFWLLISLFAGESAGQV